MTAPTLVSVIIATNRRGEFLDEAIRSVTEQTHPAWEIIVVDDGSPEPELLDRIVRNHPNTRVIHQSGAGVSVARNVGVAASAGEYCAFLDDDDVWLPTRLTLQLAALEADDAAVLSYGRVSSMDASGRITTPPDQRAAADIHDLFDGTAMPQFQTVLVRRRELIRVGGFHSALRAAEDLDLLLRLAREGRFAFVDQELARYRHHGHNVTGAYRPLAQSIDAVARLHAVRAEAQSDGTANDLGTRRRANRRYAFWRAVRAARERGGAGGTGDLLWAVRFAPLAPLDAILRRLERGRDRRDPA